MFMIRKLVHYFNCLINIINNFIVKKKINYLFKIEKVRYLCYEISEIKAVLKFSNVNLNFIPSINLFYLNMHPLNRYNFFTIVFLILNPFKFFFLNYFIIIKNLNTINKLYLKKKNSVGTSFTTLISNLRQIKIILRENKLYQNYFQNNNNKQVQVFSSFDYQWKNLNEGELLLSNFKFKQKFFKC